MKLITVTRVHLESLLRWALTKTAAATTTELCFKAKKTVACCRITIYVLVLYIQFICSNFTLTPRPTILSFSCHRNPNTLSLVVVAELKNRTIL